MFNSVCRFYKCPSYFYYNNDMLLTKHLYFKREFVKVCIFMAKIGAYGLYAGVQYIVFTNQTRHDDKFKSKVINL